MAPPPPQFARLRTRRRAVPGAAVSERLRQLADLHQRARARPEGGARRLVGLPVMSLTSTCAPPVQQRSPPRQWHTPLGALALGVASPAAMFDARRAAGPTPEGVAARRTRTRRSRLLPCRAALLPPAHDGAYTLTLSVPAPSRVPALLADCVRQDAPPPVVLCAAAAGWALAQLRRTWRVGWREGARAETRARRARASLGDNAARVVDDSPLVRSARRGHARTHTRV